MRLLDGSGVNREVHAPFCERPGVQFLRPTCQTLHRFLDVIFGDYQLRAGSYRAALNLPVLRQFALNLSASARPSARVVSRSSAFPTAPPTFRAQL